MWPLAKATWIVPIGIPDGDSRSANTSLSDSVHVTRATSASDGLWAMAIDNPLLESAAMILFSIGFPSAFTTEEATMPP
jgi:hypothetical protein